jgi:cytochrome b
MQNEVKVWDPLIRLFHWGLVIAFAVSYLTQEESYDLHLFAGYALGALLIFRLVWGFAGPRHARFTDFMYGPSRVLAYLGSLVRGDAPRFVGHNPAGGSMVLAMLSTLTVIVVSGIALDAAENRAGPLAHTRLFYYTDLIEQVHALSTNVALVLVILHLIGVIHASLTHRENLLKAMLTGRKRA